MAGKVKIVFQHNVVDFLDELLFVLYEENYFSYKSSAYEYVLKIADFIEYNIEKLLVIVIFLFLLTY